MFDGKTILITGGTGSFGSTFARRLLKDGSVKEIRILSRDESKQEAMRTRLKSNKIMFYIGDVRDRDSLLSALSGVDYVFHAAALKQVPSCEFYPIEALKTNVLGAENVMCAAETAGVKRVVFLSTDKAVNPINVMGQTKSLMESMVQAKARFYRPGQPIYCCTRYGNVMCSRGSVIPLFVDQIKRGEPITITDPLMTRFMMTLEESVDLVLYALEKGQPGDVLVQKAPAATIEVLAEALQSLLGKRVAIRAIGVRHGEKMHEVLVSEEEMRRAEDHERYYRIPLDERNLNYTSFTVSGLKSQADVQIYNSYNTQRLDVASMKTLLLRNEYIQTILDEMGVMV
jgi:UDP-N-acetylglucosamine 4,6-dehydratase/5-epimerase